MASFHKRPLLSVVDWAIPITSLRVFAYHMRLRHKRWQFFFFSFIEVWKWFHVECWMQPLKRSFRVVGGTPCCKAASLTPNFPSCTDFMATVICSSIQSLCLFLSGLCKTDGADKLLWWRSFFPRLVRHFWHPILVREPLWIQSHIFLLGHHHGSTVKVSIFNSVCFRN